MFFNHMGIHVEHNEYDICSIMGNSEGERMWSHITIIIIIMMYVLHLLLHYYYDIYDTIMIQFSNLLLHTLLLLWNLTCFSNYKVMHIVL